MDFDELLQCLVEAEQGQPRPELTGGRYVVVDYVAPAPVTSAVTAAAVEGAGEKLESAEDHSFGVVGVAPSFYQALDLLGEALGCVEELAELDEEEWAAEMAAELGMDVADEDEEDDEEESATQLEAVSEVPPAAQADSLR